MSVYQVRATSSAPARPKTPLEPPPQPVLEPKELTILTAWAEALAEALTVAPERAEAVPANAHTGPTWRAELGIADPSPQLDQAISLIDEAVRTTTGPCSNLGLEALLPAIRDSQPGNSALDRLARRVLRSALEQRQNRQTPRNDLGARRCPSPTTPRVSWPASCSAGRWSCRSVPESPRAGREFRRLATLHTFGDSWTRTRQLDTRTAQPDLGGDRGGARDARSRFAGSRGSP